jgi:hypothetical protein
MKEKKEKKVFLGINISNEIKEKLTKLAKNEKRSISSQVSLILEQILKRENNNV